jgi:hypothetical protein
MILKSTPFTRPNIKQLIGGLQYVVDFEHKYPARGDRTKIK